MKLYRVNFEVFRGLKSYHLIEAKDSEQAKRIFQGFPGCSTYKILSIVPLTTILETEF